MLSKKKPGMQGVMEHRPGARGVAPRQCLEALPEGLTARHE